MGNYDKFRVTLMGANKRDGTGTPLSETVWVIGPKDTPEMVGDMREFAGAVLNDSGQFRQNIRLPMIPFGLPEGSIEGHDSKLYYSLLINVLSRKFKFITAVEGVDVAGTATGQQFWEQLLTAYDDMIPIAIKSIQVEFPDDNTRVVTLDTTIRYPGLPTL